MALPRPENPRQTKSGSIALTNPEAVEQDKKIAMPSKHIRLPPNMSASFPVTREKQPCRRESARVHRNETGLVAERNHIGCEYAIHRTSGM